MANMEDTVAIKFPEKYGNQLLFKISEAAEILSVSVKTVRRLLERGLLKTNPALRHKLITRESIEAFARMTL
jgi:excisionase family DNA binding protein